MNQVPSMPSQESSRSDLTSFQVLFRLYDLPTRRSVLQIANQQGLQIRLLRFEEQKQVESFLNDYAPSLLYRESFGALPNCIITWKEDCVEAVCFYDVRSLGTVGPLLAKAACNSTVERLALLETMHHMYRYGYRYAVNHQIPEPVSSQVAEICGVQIPVFNSNTSAEQRDCENMPWADIFSPLSPMILDFEIARITIGNKGETVQIRVAVPSEQQLVVQWIATEFGRGWASEIERAFTKTPISCIIAVHTNTSLEPEERLLGFVGYDCAAIGMGSAIAVHPKVGRWNASSIIQALAVAVAQEMYLQGYEYIIGSGMSNRLFFLEAGPQSWTIPGSYPGPFRDIVVYK